MGTLDGNLIAIDARDGRLLWTTPLGRPEAGYAVTGAPLVVKDKVITGPAGGEYGISGFLAAYDAATGRQVWRFNTVPHPGEPGHDTWAGDSWKHGRRFDLERRHLRPRRPTPSSGASAIPVPTGTERCGRRQPVHQFGHRARRRHGTS